MLENAAMLHKTLAVIPAHNEEDTVGQVVAGVRALGLEALVVDDGSQDDTLQEARSQGAKTLSLAVQLGAWGAIQTGMRYCLREGYEYCASIDADGQHLPQSLADFLDPDQLEECDVLIGSCPERVSWMRRLAWGWFRGLGAVNLQDLTSGLRLYNRRAMQLLLQKQAYMFDYQDLGVLLLLRKQGLKIKEIPVQMLPRVKGHSRVFRNWLVVCRYMAVVSSMTACKFKQGPKQNS